MLSKIVKKNYPGAQRLKKRSGIEQVGEIEKLIRLIPDSPSFWGDDITYPKKKKKLWGGFSIDKGPNISSIRDDVHSFSKGEVLSKTRSVLTLYLKKYPTNPDLHALKAIMIYNDLSQSSRRGDKLEIMGEALQRIGKALHNGGGSIFNVTWFMNIYIKYLELLGISLARQYKQFAGKNRKAGDGSSEKLFRKLTKIPQLLQVRSSLRTLARLNMKLKGSSLITDTITAAELREASQSIASRKEKKMGKRGRPANSVIHVTMAVYSVLSRVPSLDLMVKGVLKNVSEACPELILQKQLVLNTGKTTKFNLYLASGNHAQAKKVADDIYHTSLGVIRRHLKDSILFKQYEVDPYLKLAWVALEASSLYLIKERRERYREVADKLKFLLDNRCQHGNSIKAATYYQHEIETALDLL